MITPQTITDYVRQVLTDAQVTVTDRTGTMDHLNVRVVSDGFQGKIYWIVTVLFIRPWMSR